MVQKIRLKTIRNTIEEVNKGELENKYICIFCLASRLSIEDSLHYREDIKEGPHTSDLKCLHCYDTEEEFGRFKLTKEQKIYVSEVLEQLENCKQKAYK